MNNVSIRNSLTTKFILTVVLLLLMAMSAVIITVRNTVQQQFVHQYQRNFEINLRALQTEFRNRNEFVMRQLSDLSDRLQQDNDFRLYGAVLEQYTKPYLVNYASNAIGATGLDALMILDREGTLLSSGHYKSAFGSDKSGLLQQFRRSDPGPRFYQFQTPDDPLLSLAGIDSVQLGTSKFYMLGGVHISATALQQLAKTPENIILSKEGSVLVHSSEEPPVPGFANLLKTGLDETKKLESGGEEFFVGSAELPLITEGSIDHLTLSLINSAEELNRLLSHLNRRILYITLGGMLLAILLLIWRTTAVTKPLKQLAEKARNLSLDSLDIQFDVESQDEVGTLNHVMQRLATRLRKERLQLAQAEKQAAIAEVAREVNHDIKNGFIPIRNVLQHWEEAAEEDPDELKTVFHERKSTVFESLDYLESLARNYSRLKPDIQERPMDVHGVIRGLLDDYFLMTGEDITMHMNLNARNSTILGDPVQLRRAFENIIQNGLEALSGEGEIRVTSENRNGAIILKWMDSGEGIPEEVRKNLFQMPVSTKVSGSGIGLSNVKRITEDFNGTLEVDSHRGKGTQIVLEFPLAPEDSNDTSTEIG